MENNMNIKEQYKRLMPLFLRRSNTLTEEEILFVKEQYKQIGLKSLDSLLVAEKQKRPYAAFLLTEIDCDKDYWSVVYDDYCKRNQAIIQIADTISKDFYDRGGKTLCINENFGTLLSSDMPIGNFASGDIDFSVNKEEEELAREVFNANGFFEQIRSDHSDISSDIEWRFHNPSALDGKGFWLDLKRKPIGRSYLMAQKKYVERLTRVRKEGLVKYKDTNIRILEPTAMLYFNALHFASEHHYSASPDMALCCDMDRVISDREIDWNRLARWSKEDNAGLRIQMALDVTKFFLKTDIPEGFLGSKTVWYQLLWHRLIDEKNNLLISQDGKWARLVTELLSDNTPILYSLFSRIWRR